MEGIMTKAGLGSDVPSTMQQSFEKAGLENVTIQKVQLPAGKLLSNEEDIQNSLLPFKLSIPGLVKIGASKSPCPRFAAEDCYSRYFVRYGH